MAAAGVALAGCPSGVRKPEAPSPAQPLAAPDLRGATTYEIDATDSTVAIQVRRSGTLARLGHNHVMTSKNLSGRVWLQSALAHSGFEMTLPVNDLIVDDKDARARAGADFPGEIPQTDRDGTRKNMLRTEVLDSEHFATISLRSVAIRGSLPAVTAIARITIKGRNRDIEIPVNVTVSEATLTAKGAFDILQTDFGIKPFSIALGALEVEDKLHIEFALSARRH
jgi:polyisoprenoid-binding protein YceI